LGIKADKNWEGEIRPTTKKVSALRLSTLHPDSY